MSKIEHYLNSIIQSSDSGVTVHTDDVLDEADELFIKIKYSLPDTWTSINEYRKYMMSLPDDFDFGYYYVMDGKKVRTRYSKLGHMCGSPQFMKRFILDLIQYEKGKND